MFVPVVVSLVLKVQAVIVCTCSGILGAEGEDCQVFVPAVVSLVLKVQVVWCLYLVWFPWC